MSSHVEVLFESAAERMRSNTALQLSSEQRLELYGYYKQATEGSCTSSKPSFFDFQGRAKWEAWHKRSGLSRDEAKQCYVELVDKLDPNWRDSPLTTEQKDHTKPVSGGGGPTGPVVSRMANYGDDGPILSDSEKTLIDWATEGSVERVVQCLKEGQDINMKDNEGMTPLHWACDRGYLEIVKCLAEHGADLNIKDMEGQTPLHYATSCGHHDVILHLLSLGADPNITDNEGQSPIDISDHNVKDIFNKK